jgi:YebC/PmpR family DNA-binding regulatory protein
MKKGSGADAIHIEEVTYEAMGPGGVAMIIVCATDNTNRTLTDVKTALKKNNGKFVPSGSVSFQFDYVGYISIVPTNINDAELTAIDAGAEDVFEKNTNLIIITKPTDLHNILENIKSETTTINEAKLIYNPTQQITLTKDDKEKYETLFDILEDLDDVSEIFDNVS